MSLPVPAVRVNLQGGSYVIVSAPIDEVWRRLRESLTTNGEWVEFTHRFNDPTMPATRHLIDPASVVGLSEL